MKINKTSKIVCAAAIVLSGFIGYIKADQSETIPVTVNQSSNSCVGVYYAYAKMTNNYTTFWITPPTNTKTGTFSDMSGFPAPYSAWASVTRKSDSKTWCQTNSVTFPATNSSYAMTVFVTSTPPPPTNGQAMVLKITWQ